MRLQLRPAAYVILLKDNLHRQRSIPGFAIFGRNNQTMRTLCVIVLLALVAIAFEIYSDPGSSTSAKISRAVADPAAVAIAGGLKRE